MGRDGFSLFNETRSLSPFASIEFYLGLNVTIKVVQEAGAINNSHKSDEGCI